MKRTSLVCLILFLIAIMFPGATTILADDTSYKIGPGDVLEISVWKDESLSRNIIVPPDRMISFPLVADINGNNMTVTMLRETIRKKLSEYVPDATVTVILKEINSLKAFVIGKANKPGEFSIGLDTTIMQVLSMAGGLNPFADEGKINILRQSDGKTTRIFFDYKEVIKGKGLEQNILVQKGRCHHCAVNDICKDFLSGCCGPAAFAQKKE